MGPLLITATAVRRLIDSNSTEFARFQQDTAVEQPSRDRRLYGSGAATVPPSIEAETAADYDVPALPPPVQKE